MDQSEIHYFQFFFFIEDKNLAAIESSYLPKLASSEFSLILQGFSDVKKEKRVGIFG
ncbi:MAG TPA: hypothetical protein H9951_15415 [Candidatus Bacteroides intestinigallinarum]|nr:hypothetical protein [Candidatus Bacteroides intestinigallinarum]